MIRRCCLPLLALVCLPGCDRPGQGSLADANRPPDSSGGPDARAVQRDGPRDSGDGDRSARDGAHADAGSTLATVPFADTFLAKANIGVACTKTVDIAGREPTAGQSYPVFIWTPGTGGTASAVTETALARAMSERGFVAAAVDYNTLANIADMNCDKIKAKASCVYDPSKPGGAVARLCARPKADCSKGIVVAGLSQGSFMAMLAKNYDSRVRAAYVLGAGNDQASTFFEDMSLCLNDGNRSLPGDRLRAVNGENDANWVNQQQQLEAITGQKCAAGAKQCLRANGSGWYVVADSQVQDGSADHCYHVVGGCSNTSPLDPGYSAGSDPWAMKPNLDWLAGFAD